MKQLKELAAYLVALALVSAILAAIWVLAWFTPAPKKLADSLEVELDEVARRISADLGVEVDQPNKNT